MVWTENCKFIRKAIIPEIIGILFIFILIYPASAAAWPEESQWNIVTKNSTPLIDPLGDAPNEREIVGNLTNPAVIFSITAQRFFSE